MNNAEIKEMLFAFLLFGLALIASRHFFSNQDIIFKKGVLKETPRFIKQSKNNRFVFNIEEDSINRYELRYVYSDLGDSQKDMIKKIGKRGSQIEFKYDAESLYREAYEIYALKIDGIAIYTEEDHAKLQKKERLFALKISIFSLVGLAIFFLFRFKNRNCLLYLFLMLGFGIAFYFFVS